MPTPLLRRSALAVTVAQLLVASAHAAEPAAGGGLEEVVVTAQRRGENLQQVPIAVSAIEQSALQDRQVTAPQDLQRLVPSLKMTNNITSPTNLSPSLRGSTQQDASLVVAESPFGIYVDDVYVGRLNGNNVQFPDMERVEVLRGPQGTLYGRNTLSGAIKFVSRTPTDTSWADVSVGAGNHNQYRGVFSVGGPLGAGWAGSVAGMYSHKDGEWFNRGSGQESGLEKNAAGRVKLHYSGIEHFDAQLFASYVKSDNDALQQVNGTTPGIPSSCLNSAGAYIAGCHAQYRIDQVKPTFGRYTTNFPLTPPPLIPGLSLPYGPAPIENQPRGETKQLISGLSLSWEIGSATLRSITGYVDTKDFFSTDFSGVGTIVAGAVSDSKQVTQEFQVLGKALDDRLNYILGAYYLHERSDQDFGWFFLLPSSTNQIDTTIRSVSAFAQVQYKLTDALQATAGVRWTQDKKDFGVVLQRLPTALVPDSPLDPKLACPGVASPDSVCLKNTYTQTTPKLGLDYTVPTFGPFDAMLAYVSAAKGFKSGGYNGINIFDLTVAQTAYAPETNWTYEAGLKTDLLDRKLRVNAAYYYTKAKDLALNATVIVNGAPTFPVQNSGDATIQGLELEVTARPMTGLTVFMNGAFQTGKYTRLAAGSAPQQAIAKFGIAEARPPQLPGLAGSLGFDVDVPVGDSARLLVGTDLYHTNAYLSAATNDLVISPFSLLNGYVGIGWGKFDVRATGRNLQNRSNFTTGSRDLGGYYALPPREYMLTFSYRM